MRHVASGRSIDVSPTWAAQDECLSDGRGTGAHTFDRKIVLTSGLCWNHCKIRMRSV